ncbi:5'-3' DNA helicase ZGRF1-like N-terminal domain-containing protein (Fragment) [Madurella fahalii]|uniref:5'-3' DNA helicase ZGRF1-like N-terminal domain-containing protein n=1 Tax=Madurella fahalii TaxID=1157608 RepID=A0ABQ0G3S6_9PEZI
MPSTPIPGTAVSAASGPSSGGHNAPVLEFLCLFTYDLRRKQKRWQDGRLKYHTFNKRVMVYDDRGNFVGDMHWRREWEFDEGEEVELERGGIIVQVAECVGRQNQDLSELLDKRVKERAQRQARVATRSPFSVLPARTPLSAPVVQDHFQTRHRPLNQLLGTPTGHHGRAAVPTESPFELRQKASEAPGARPDSRPAKRRKHDTTPPSKMGYAQSLFGAPLTLSAVPVSSAPPRRLTPASRTASEIPGPREGAISDAELRSEDTGLCAHRGPLTKSSGDDLIRPPSKPRAVTERYAVRGEHSGYRGSC